MATAQSHGRLLGDGDRNRTGSNMSLLVETKSSPAALTPASNTEGQARPNKASDQLTHADHHMDLKVSCSSAGLQDQPGQHQQQDAAQYQQLQQPETPSSACRSQPSQLMQIHHGGRTDAAASPADAAAPPADAAASSAAAAATLAIPASGIRPSSLLDKMLAGQGMVQVR